MASTTTLPIWRAFAGNANRAATWGYGKTLIHPNQIAACNAAFSPEVAQARKIIAAFDVADNHATGVVQIEGRMVERLHAEAARRLVAIAEAIGNA